MSNEIIEKEANAVSSSIASCAPENKAIIVKVDPPAIKVIASLV